MITDLTGLFGNGYVVDNHHRKRFGLNEPVLNRTSEEFFDFCSRIDLFDYPLGYTQRSIEEGDVRPYVPNLSLIRALTGNNLSGVRIVEVGSGTIGIACLAYLQSQGASVLGIDAATYPYTLASRLRVPFFSGKWEQVECILKMKNFEQADILYTTNMEPEPWKRSGVTRDCFDGQTAAAIDGSLAPSGVFFSTITGLSDYWYPVGLLKERGFKGADVRLVGGWGSTVRIWQKPIFEESVLSSSDK
jgi:hypothetical protein